LLWWLACKHARRYCHYSAAAALLSCRQALKEYSNWPTYPQLYVDGELVGGCDIVLEMQQTGDLQQLIKEKAPAALQPPKQQQQQPQVRGRVGAVGDDPHAVGSGCSLQHP
jgi:hypothetical protein